MAYLSNMRKLMDMENHQINQENFPTITNKPALKNLEQAVKRDLELLNYPARAWLKSSSSENATQNVFDVLIIGGGQSGLACAFGLIREKISNILVLDENPKGQEGPWLTFARMHTLRTPKHLTGPDLGIPSLTPRSWYEAKYGEEAWQNLKLISKEDWAAYLNWYKNILNLPVQNNSKAGAITWDKESNCFEVPVTNTITNKTNYLKGKKIVLATGIDGSGQWEIPKIIQENLPTNLYAHTRDQIDFNSLKNKTIAVLGAGASAFDNASLALETGAKEIHLFFRRKELPNINPYRWAEFSGFLNHHSNLSDEKKWQFILQIIKMGQLPPADTFARATQHNNFYMHPDSTWESLSYENNKIQIHTKNKSFLVDFIIVGTGCITDLSLRPELSNFIDKIALWKDRYNPKTNEISEDLLRHPYLGENFEFTEKSKGEAPYLASLFNYTFGALLSMGFSGASISGMKYSLPKLIHGISKQFYVDNIDYYFETLKEFDKEEFQICLV